MALDELPVAAGPVQSGIRGPLWTLLQLCAGAPRIVARALALGYGFQATVPRAPSRCAVRCVLPWRQSMDPYASALAIVTLWLQRALG